MAAGMASQSQRTGSSGNRRGCFFAAWASGASAAALYGNRGANGVILITTKKGAIGKPRISYSNSTSFSRPFVTPEFQNTYGRKEGEFKSWGDKLDKPSTYNPLDFFQTGFNI